MFCNKCGNKLEENAIFCGNCGAKVYKKNEFQTSMQPLPKINHETAGVATPLTAEDLSIDSVEMVVSIEKAAGRAYSKIRVPVLVDNLEMGKVLNGEISTYKISSGSHCIKIGSVRIWVNIPQGATLINLNFKWGPNVKPEIVCSQDRFVTKLSEIEGKTERQLCILYAIISCLIPIAGAIGFFSFKKTYPKVAKIAGIFTIIGLVVNAILIVLVSSL